MSNCKLSTHEQYPLNSVQFDKGTGKLAVHLSNPPQASCPDGFFTSKAATLTVDPNITISTLTYTNHPVVLVPSKGIVQQVDSTPPSSFPFGTFIILALIGAAIYGYFKGWYSSWFNSATPTTANTNSNNVFTSKAQPSSKPDTTVNKNNFASGPVLTGYHRTTSNYPHSAPSVNTTVTAPAPPPGQTVVVHDSGMGNFASGMIIGSALSGGFDHHDTVIREREVIHDNSNNNSYSSDDNSNSSSSYRSDDSSSSYSSDDSGSSFSSDDSSSSYSSDDSSSSYSSDDSSSSYSSDDSGSSFSSDDSGSSFSSDDSGSSFSSDDSSSSFSGD